MHRFVKIYILEGNGNPRAVQVMAEAGVDISGHRSKQWMNSRTCRLTWWSPSAPMPTGIAQYSWVQPKWSM